MTENNAAQAIQEGERNAAADQYFKARAWVMDTNDNRRIFEAGFDRAYALLSKLRAEGVQAGDLPTMQSAFRITEQHGDPDPAKRQYHMVFKFRSSEDMNAADDEWRAALASAPVAGEAIYQIKLPGDTESGWHDATEGAYWTATEKTRRIVFVAPQASEAVRLDAPAQVGGVRFGNGIHWSTVIAAAQRHHAFMNTPEKEAERIARAKEFVESIQADKDGAQSPANRPESRASIDSKGGALDGGDCAKGAGDGKQKYWLCCGSKDPNHPNRRAPDCFNADRAKWGTADQHSGAQKQGDSDA